jgi:thiamine-monophosphate kinase
LGERLVIETLWKHFERTPSATVPFGDDVAAFEGGEGSLILKTDMLVASTDVPPSMNYWQAARKSVVMNISDFAAKGAKPRGLLVALGIPPQLEKGDIEQLGKGLNAGAREYGSYILGGDTNEAQDLVIGVAAFGFAKTVDLVLRTGACPGDIVATTGRFGLTSAGLRILKNGFTAPQGLRERLVRAVLHPRARLREGLALAKTGAATSSIDSSDGLAWSLYQLGAASDVGFVIDFLPTAPEVVEFAKRHNLNPEQLCLYGGEEYELVVTINPRLWTKAQKAIRREEGNLIRIGQATERKEIHLNVEGQERVVEPRGYEHFKMEGSD